MVQDDGPVGLDCVAVAFDDERAVADAGIVLAATLAQRLGIEALVDDAICLGDRPGAANAGAKVMTLVSAMAWVRTASMTATCCVPAGPATSSGMR